MSEEKKKSGAILRLTTDQPDDNMSMAFNLFFAKDRLTWARNCGPEPEFGDIKLTDLIRLAAKTMNIPDLALPVNDSDLDCLMADMVADGPEEPEGLLAIIHTAGWAFAELRARLKDYEDSGAPRIDDKELETLVTAVHTWAPGAQIDIAIEEMSELTKALLKYRRMGSARGSVSHDQLIAQAEECRRARENIGEEMADVFIMLYQLLYIFGNAEQVQTVVWEKIERLKGRIAAFDAAISKSEGEKHGSAD